MRLMILVGVLVGLLYYVLPLLAPSGPSPDNVDAYGEPWTLPEFSEALRTNGLAVDVHVFDTRGDEDEFLSAGVLASGQINDFRVLVLIYEKTSTRSLDWREIEEGRVQPRVEPLERAFHTVFYAADNAVIVVFAPLQGPGYDFAEIRQAVLGLARN